jgi:HD-like signal output (HDOD) protein/DNA-binding NarL/FixJ family response regulator
LSKILIVEDHAIIREPIEVALDNAGFEVIVATNGVAGLLAFNEHKPDLVLLDIAMPEMDGLAMLRKLRTFPGGADVPVIMLTALADKNKVVEAAALGIKGYVLKSRFSLHELLTLVRNQLPDPALLAKVVAKPQAPAGASDGADDETAAMPGTRARGSSLTEAGGKTPAAATGGRDGLSTIRPLLTRNEVVKRLGATSELKGFSPAVAEVLKLTSNARCSMESVAKALSRDHGLALKVLKLSNSAVYTRGEPVDSVSKAVLRIGLGQIRQAVLNIAVIDRFTDAAAGEFIEVGQFWEHAIATGIIAAEITHVRSEKEADAAFTCGLLHDVGRLLLLEALKEEYTAVLQTASRLQVPVEQVEQHMLGLQHSEVMEHTLQLWKFSKQLVTPVVLHHLSAGNIRTTAPQQVHEVATIALANRLAHALLLGHAGNQIIYPTEDLCELLCLDEKLIERIETWAPEETVKVKFALLAVSNQSNWEPLSVTHRQTMGAPFVPVYASSTPVFDAHRMFCKGLTAEPTEDEELAANIGVVSFRNAREVEQVWGKFVSAETKAGAVSLPVMLLSPTGKIAPPEPTLSGRKVVQLATPFAVHRFVDVVHDMLAPAEGQREAA